MFLQNFSDHMSKNGEARWKISSFAERFKRRFWMDIGICLMIFGGFSGHKSSFNLERYRHSTALSTEAWRIKENDGVPILPGELYAKKNHTHQKRDGVGYA